MPSKKVTDAVTDVNPSHHAPPAETSAVTDVTGLKYGTPRGTLKNATSVTPVMTCGNDGCDGSKLLIPQAYARTRPHAGQAFNPSHPSSVTPRPRRRRPAKPTDPTGAGTTARIVVAHTPDGDEFHLAATQPIRIGYIICARGEPLCGIPGRLRLPGLLFPPDVTCWMCALIARRDHITIDPADQSERTETQGRMPKKASAA